MTYKFILALFTLRTLKPFLLRILSRLFAFDLLSLPHLCVESISRQMFGSIKKSITNWSIGCWKIYLTFSSSRKPMAIVSCGSGLFLNVFAIVKDILFLDRLFFAGFFRAIRLLCIKAKLDVSFLRPNAQWLGPVHSPFDIRASLDSKWLRNLIPRRLHSLWKTSRETLQELLRSSNDLNPLQCKSDIIFSNGILKCDSILSKAFILQPFKLRVVLCQQ